MMWTEAEGGKWIEPRAGLLPDEAILTYPNLAALVTGIDIPLIGPLPDGLLMVCRLLMPGVTYVTPSRLRQSLRRHRPHNYLMQLSLDDRVKVRPSLHFNTPVSAFQTSRILYVIWLTGTSAIMKVTRSFVQPVSQSVPAPVP